MGAGTIGAAELVGGGGGVSLRFALCPLLVLTLSSGSTIGFDSGIELYVA